MAASLQSVKDLEHVVQDKIEKERAEGRVLGPFPTPSAQFEGFTLGAVPKKAPGEFRLIHHLSYAQGSSVNDTIPGELCTVKYTSFDQAVQIVRTCGVEAKLVKCE